MKISINISFGIILLIVFFNRALLPFGLQYSLLLTPFFISNLHFQNKLKKTIVPILVLLIFGVFQVLSGVNFNHFLVSNILMISIIFFATNFYYFYKKTDYIDVFIEKLTQFNFIFTIIALFSLLSGKFVSIFWYSMSFTEGYKVIPRLKLFELEASHYSFVLLPFFFYYFWKVLQQFEWKTTFLLLTVVLSLSLSFSFGVLAVIVLSLILTSLFHLKNLIFFKNTRQVLVSIVILSSIILIVLYLFYPENPIFFRIKNIISGVDTSGRGRTYESFEIAWQVLQQKNEYFGIGLGQFKTLGRITLSFYYKFMNIPDVVRIPNTMAETLVVFGIVGFSLKNLFLLFLFFKMKVYENIFQLSLFFSLFIYQYTGSYIFNNIEYIFWIMAFYPKLSFFNRSKFYKK